METISLERDVDYPGRISNQGDIPEAPVDGDHIDRIYAQLAGVRPGLDARGLPITGRILRLAGRLQTERTDLLAALELAVGDFDVLATIRRARSITAGEISGAVMVTAGGITKRLDRLAARGLIERAPDPHDRRSAIVTLTAAGCELIDAAYDRVMAAEAEFVTRALPDAADANVVVDGLRSLMLVSEQFDED